MKKKIIYMISVLLILMFSLGPILWCVVISMTGESEMLKNTSSILPQTMIFDNYAEIFDSSSKAHQVFLNGLYNSLRISALTLIIAVPLTVVTGYALYRYNFKGKKFLINFLLLTTVIPVFATIIPVYNIFRNLDLLDSMFWTSIIYVSSIVPLNIWIVMNYFKQLPKEIYHAASLDGFNEKDLFFKIVMPLSKPTILTISLIIFLMSWKQYVIPIILMSSYDNRTITMVMSEFMTRYEIRYGIISACGILSILPPAICAIVFRKFLVENLASGAVKQ